MKRFSKNQASTGKTMFPIPTQEEKNALVGMGLVHSKAIVLLEKAISELTDGGSAADLNSVTAHIGAAVHYIDELRRAQIQITAVRDGG